MAPWGNSRQAPGAHPPEATPPGVVGADRAEIGGTLPGRVHQPGQRPPQRCREGAGPAHARMVGGAADPLSPVPPTCNGRSRVHVVPCSPSHRTVAPTLRTRCLSRIAPSTVASSSSSRPSVRPGSPGPRAWAGTHPKQRVPARAKRHVHRRRPPSSTEAGQRRHRADGTLADRRERQAGHAELDLQLTSSPSTRSRASPARSARCPATTSPCSSTRTAQRRPGAGLPDGLLPGPRRPPRRADGLHPGQGPARAGGHARHRHGDLPVVAHAHAQHHEGLAARLLPLEARR